LKTYIRLAEFEDIERINDIYNQAVAHKFQTADTIFFTLNDRVKWFNNHQSAHYPIIVAIKNDEVVGWASISQYRNGRAALLKTVEVSFYIDQDHQHQGIGTQLLNATIEKAKELGYKNVFAMLMEPNAPSIGLLQKFSFEEWGRLPKVAEVDHIEIDHVYYGRRIAD